MYKSKNFKAHILIALFLTVVIMSTFLIKPVHILFEHSELSDIALPHSEYAVLSQLEHSDCPICDFEFCFFVSSNFVEIEKSPEFYAKKISPQPVDCPIYQISHNFLLRAPPIQ